MMPIAASDFPVALFNLLVSFAAIFSPPLRAQAALLQDFVDGRKGILFPIRHFPRQLRPKLVQANVIPAARPIGFSNAPRVFAGAHRSTQNVSGISQPSPPIPQSPCSPKPPCAPPVSASRRAASPATSSRAVVAPAGPHLPDPLCF